MANKMLIDAAHPEETRVVVLRGNRVEEFDFESASKKQLRGNIYLAKVTRVEPSLQAAFVDYGGNRHGFLAFAEIHPDYYQIPVSDRQALLDAEAQEDHEEEEERRSRRRRRRGGDRHAAASTARDEKVSEEAAASGHHADGDETDHHAPIATSEHDEAPHSELSGTAPVSAFETEAAAPAPHETSDAAAPLSEATAAETTAHPDEPPATFESSAHGVLAGDDDPIPLDPHAASGSQSPDHSEPGAPATEASSSDSEDDDEDEDDEEDHVEQLGGDALEEVPHRAYRPRRQYKIQEVIKRRQVLLVQVVKEERGNKGAALTTYLSLAGRYSVLMPNTARGGGISRKITDAGDRQRLKSIAQDLDVPDGMGVILRTAGASRTKPEVKRDFEYLMRMWETVRETTLKSQAPTLVYEEGSLIKRAIRDLYNKDIDEVIVSGEGGYREAKDFMRLLMPSHSRNVQPWRDPQPIFTKFGAETQLDAMFSNHVTLKSGGYIVINQTEALVAIDVNSGRSTREHNIEDTALRTNLEAADEVARQLRLRDLAGLIVVDFIDMEENRNNRAVERRMKDALKNDRARIQIGRISHFGLLEMSRQRIRTGVLEGSTVVCDHCAGSGMVRSTASIALYVLRTLEDSLIADASHNLVVNTRVAVALYILNQKRAHLTDIELRFGVAISFEHDHTLTGTAYCTIEKGEPASGIVQPMRAMPTYAPELDEPVPAEEEIESESDEADGPAGEAQGRREDGEGRRRRRRRRGRDRGQSEIAADAPQPPDDALAFTAEASSAEPPIADDEDDDVEAEGDANGTPTDGRSRRRRSRRGGRRAREARERRETGTGGPEDFVEGEAPEAIRADEDHGSVDLQDVVAAHPAPAPIEPSPIAVAEEAAAPEVPPAAAAAPLEPVVVAQPAPTPSETPSPARPEPVSSPLDPSRPKRSGWWQRAKATLSGQ